MKKKLIDPMNLKGRVRITLRGSNGKIKSSTVKNTVVTVGKQHVANLLAAGGDASMSHMAIGTGTTAVDLTDTALETELDRNALSDKDQGTGAEANKVIYGATWLAGDGTGAITEAGLFNSDAGGIMLARTVFSVKNKGAGDSLTITWTITVN